MQNFVQPPMISLKDVSKSDISITHDMEKKFTCHVGSSVHDKFNNLLSDLTTIEGMANVRFASLENF